MVSFFAEVKIFSSERNPWTSPVHGFRPGTHNSSCKVLRILNLRHSALLEVPFPMVSFFWPKSVSGRVHGFSQISVCTHISSLEGATELKFAILQISHRTHNSSLQGAMKLKFAPLLLLEVPFPMTFLPKSIFCSKPKGFSPNVVKGCYGKGAIKLSFILQPYTVM